MELTMCQLSSMMGHGESRTSGTGVHASLPPPPPPSAAEERLPFDLQLELSACLSGSIPPTGD